MNPFARALYDICLEEGNTSSIETIRNAAFVKIQGGEVKSLVSSSLNGKSFNFNISKPADELFAAASWAIRQFNNGVVKATSFDFSDI